MSQLSPQDLQSLQQLIGVIAPKIIERLKACEATVVSMAGDIDNLQKQVAALHTAAPKAEKPKRGSKKKELEVPQLLPGSETATPGVPPAQAEVAFSEVIESPLAQTVPQTEADVSAASSVPGSPAVGTVAVIPNAVVETGELLSGQTSGGALEFPIVDGIQVTDQLIFGTQYIMQQGYTDPAVIAQSLQTLPSVVQAIMNMSVTEQAALMELARQQQAGA